MSRCPTCEMPSKPALGWLCAIGDFLEDAIWCVTPWYVPRLPKWLWPLAKLCWRLSEPRDLRELHAEELRIVEEMLPLALETWPVEYGAANTATNATATGPLNGESVTTWTPGPRW